MKTCLIFLVILSVTVQIILSVEGTEKMRKHKKYRKTRRPFSTTPEPDNTNNNGIILTNEEENDARAAAYQLGFANNGDVINISDNNINNSPNSNDAIEDNNEPLMDPCITVHCGAGRVCQLDANAEPQCVCIPSCPVETEPRRKVCSNHNETWPSDCAVYQHRCFCDTGDSTCKGEDYKHVHIEYYGKCREMRECAQEEMEDFPRRMRDWLFNIMRDLADRSELSAHYLKMQQVAETNMSRRWANAAVWKFCDLDSYPPDRSVSRHELFPIRAPLMSLEHCIAPFLDSCDSNDDHTISIQEWAKCLHLDEHDFDEKCEELLVE